MKTLWLTSGSLALTGQVPLAHAYAAAPDGTPFEVSPGPHPKSGGALRYLDRLEIYYLHSLPPELGQTLLAGNGDYARLLIWSVRGR